MFGNNRLGNSRLSIVKILNGDCWCYYCCPLQWRMAVQNSMLSQASLEMSSLIRKPLNFLPSEE